jgi:hypothetical protein
MNLASPRSLVIFSHLPSALLDLLRLFLVYPSEFIAGVAHYMKYLVKLGVYGLGVAMLGALDDQRHCPSRQSGHGVPFERSRLKDVPKRRVNNNY